MQPSYLLFALTPLYLFIAIDVVWPKINSYLLQLIFVVSFIDHAQLLPIVRNDCITGLKLQGESGCDPSHTLHISKKHCVTFENSSFSIENYTKI